MTKYLRSLTLGLGSIVAVAMVAPVNAGNYGSSTAKADIVDTAVAAGNFTTLVTAVQAAGLVETLKSDGPFTVFAPTDEAFAKIPAADLEALLADKEALTRVLTYHVVPGRLMAADVVKVSSAKTVEGESVTIDTRMGVKVDNAEVIQTDIVASNGVIHVIDTVIIPADMSSAVEPLHRYAGSARYLARWDRYVDPRGTFGR